MGRNRSRASAPQRPGVLVVLAATLLGLPADHAAAGVAPATAESRDLGDIVVQMRRFRNTDGKVRIALYRDAEDWLKEGRAYRSAVRSLERRALNVTFAGVPHGTYAVAVLHDEDGDGDMDYTLIGTPSEGFGFSRDAAVSFGPPDFEDAAITHGEDKLNLRLKIRYFL